MPLVILIAPVGLLEPYIFLLPGDKRHVDTLQTIFDDPRQSHGLYLDWDSAEYSVHDAATILERYLDQLPESVIPREHSDSFCALMGKARGYIGCNRDRCNVLTTF